MLIKRQSKRDGEEKEQEKTQIRRNSNKTDDKFV